MPTEPNSQITCFDCGREFRAKCYLGSSGKSSFGGKFKYFYMSSMFYQRFTRLLSKSRNNSQSLKKMLSPPIYKLTIYLPVALYTHDTFRQTVQ